MKHLFRLVCIALQRTWQRLRVLSRALDGLVSLRAPALVPIRIQADHPLHRQPGRRPWQDN